MNRATLKNCHNHETSKNKDTTFKIQAGIDLGVWIKYFMYHVLICAYYSETRVLVKSNRNDTPYNSNYNSFQDCFTNKLHASDCYSDKISNETYDNKSQTAKANKMAWHHLQFQTFKWYHLANVSSLPFSHMDYFINHVWNMPSVLWRCWLGAGRASGLEKTEWWVLAWLSVWSKVQTCIWSSWFHCHSLSLAPVKSRLVLPFWYRLTRVVPDKGPLNGCVCVCVSETYR